MQKGLLPKRYCTVRLISIKFHFIFNSRKSGARTTAPKVQFLTPVFTPMSKTSTKKRPNRKPSQAALATTKKRLSLGNTTSTTSKPHKKTRKKNASHQQTIQARDTLDAEYRDWRTGVSTNWIPSLFEFSVYV